MLLPRFSIRAILGATALIGVVSLVMSHAFWGHVWALAVLAALGVLAIYFVLSAILYVGASLTARALLGPPPSDRGPGHAG